MSEFIYQDIFPIEKDDTEYRLVTKDYVSTIEVDGRKILKIDPKALEIVSEEAMTDVNFFLRPAHLQKLVKILDDPEATDNDKFVAYTLLRNAETAAEGKLPSCQDTGTAIVMAKKGENVYTGANDAMLFSKGVFNTYQKNNLRYSQVVPFSMLEEKNSGTNLPAQIDIYATQGDEYKFLFVAKGGGSANKTYLYQQTKALLTEENLESFVREKLGDLGTAACPPYHLAFVIGGTSAEMNLKTVKLASTGYLDNLPTSGNEGGRAFRDLEWEEKILTITQEMGVGAQFGGKYFAHDVRVIRMPRHAASNPVGLGVSCSADRNIKAKINANGIFVEKMEKNPSRLVPANPPHLEKAVEIDLDQPMDDVLAILTKYPIKTRLSLTGTLIVARDMALDEYWIAIGGIFSALEPLPLALMIVEAWKNQREQKAEGITNSFATPFMWITGSAILNWVGAGFFGMVINTPTISYYSHGTYLIMPHGHVALLGAFGYISIAFLYMTSRANSMANGGEWNDKLSKIGFWLLTIGALLFALPTLMIGLEQTKVAAEMGYYFTRTREAIEIVQGWIWFRILPDSLMLIGGMVVFVDLTKKTFFGKKAA
ncbi:MAG TPA: hypothetical protein ENK75_06510 [Saprospiraceae bacterium]|nr:hypothetical protein [Saprospiraceae bacterium]